MNGYELSRAWFNFSMERKEVKTQHTALFMWIIELNNRLQWKKEFGLPTNETMEVLSIGNKNTYYSALKNLQDWGFIKIVQESKNQYKSCIISINKEKVPVQKCTTIDTTIDTTIGLGIDIGTVPIDKQLKQENIKTIKTADDDNISIAEKQKREIRESGGYDIEPFLGKIETANKLFVDEKVHQNITRQQLSIKQGVPAIQDFVNFCDDNEMFPRDYYESRKHFYNWLATKDINIYRR